VISSCSDRPRRGESSVWEPDGSDHSRNAPGRTCLPRRRLRLGHVPANPSRCPTPCDKGNPVRRPEFVWSSMRRSLNALRQGDLITRAPRQRRFLCLRCPALSIGRQRSSNADTWGGRKCRVTRIMRSGGAGSWFAQRLPTRRHVAGPGWCHPSASGDPVFIPHDVEKARGTDQNPEPDVQVNDPFSASAAGHGVGPAHPLKVETRVRTPLGLDPPVREPALESCRSGGSPSGSSRGAP
jgi:hypothetical protein